jgi:hypothetical protein
MLQDGIFCRHCAPTYGIVRRSGAARFLGAPGACRAFPSLKFQLQNHEKVHYIAVPAANSSKHSGGRLMVTKRVSTTNRKRKTINAGNGNPAIDPDMRRRLIAAEAYFLAERRGFVPGNELADWVAAESAVDSKFKHLA